MSQTHDYYRIRLKSLNPDSALPFNLYLNLNNKYILYLHAGDKLIKKKLSKFEERAPDNFYVKNSEKQIYKDYIHDQLSSPLLNPAEKAIILKESTFALIEELFEKPNVGESLKESKVVVNTFIDFMDREPTAMANLIDLSTHDFYTYNHSLDVGIYSLGLGALVGYQGEELQILGEGALFHDIGKRNIPLEIITKNGPLTEEEWQEMKRHPLYGIKILENYNVATEVKACCFEHHESLLGNGYPQSLKAEEIHPMAKIVSVCDTYDALTTKRSYQDPMLPSQALELMSVKLKGKYDPDLLKAMNSILQNSLKKKAG